MKVNGGHIKTEELIPQLREMMKPVGEDREILDGRSDDKFSQIVRNLKSHKTFERLGYAEYKDGMYFLLKNGDKYLQENQHLLKYLIFNYFTYTNFFNNFETINNTKHIKPLEVFDEDVIIQEGMEVITEKEEYKRSKQLRDYALSYFKEQGELNCTCCGFNFSDFYGKEIGEDFIEMHHIKPIFQYQSDDQKQTIQDAISNIVPLCSNCHRMIHRHGKQSLQIELLKKHIKNNGKFSIYK